MRENRTYGSEGGEANAFPTPISGWADGGVFHGHGFFSSFNSGATALSGISMKPEKGRSISTIRKIAAETESAHTASVATMWELRGENIPMLAKIAVSQKISTTRKGGWML